MQLVTRRKSDRQYLLLCVNFVWLFRLRFKSRYTCMLYVFFFLLSKNFGVILLFTSLLPLSKTLSQHTCRMSSGGCCCKLLLSASPAFASSVPSANPKLVLLASAGQKWLAPTGRCCCFRLICLLLLLLLLSIVVVGQAGCVCSGGGSFLIFFFLASKRCRKCVLSCFVITVLFPQYFFPY